MSPELGTLTTQPATGKKLRVAGIAGAVIVLVGVGAGIISRSATANRVKEWTDEQALPAVSIVTPGQGGDANALDLPGRLEATSRAPLYARVSGYLRRWNVDIGARVKSGQLLAEIEAPDVEQQLLQAEADLAMAEVNASLAASTARRWQSMLATDSVSKQNVDEKIGDLAAKQAVVKAQRANVERLRTLRGFTRIVAPFDGVVTSRRTDVGALINAGGSGQELFVVSDIRRLRLYVNVPQVFAGSLKQGTKATLTVPEHASRKFEAVVAAASGAVDVATGTTLIQLWVDNSASELMPGGYATVSFDLPNDASVLRVPASALIFGQSGLHVATLDYENKVVLKAVTIARDRGSTIDIAAGLAANDRVIESPPDGITSGDLVRVVGGDAAPRGRPET